MQITRSPQTHWAIGRHATLLIVDGDTLDQTQPPFIGTADDLALIVDEWDGVTMVETVADHTVIVHFEDGTRQQFVAIAA
jgi:uncharacterized membrane-anchored protein